MSKRKWFKIISYIVFILVTVYHIVQIGGYIQGYRSGKIFTAVPLEIHIGFYILRWILVLSCLVLLYRVVIKKIQK